MHAPCATAGGTPAVRTTKRIGQHAFGVRSWRDYRHAHEPAPVAEVIEIEDIIPVWKLPLAGLFD
jgi:hypothetical protein